MPSVKIVGNMIEWNRPTEIKAHIASGPDLSTAPAENDLPGVPTFTEGTETFTWTVADVPDQPQFACTITGHYQSMHGDIVVQTAGGGTASPGASPAASPAASPVASPAASASAAP